MAIHVSDDAQFYDTQMPVVSSDPFYGCRQTRVYRTPNGERIVVYSTQRDVVLLRLYRDLNILLGQLALHESIDLAGFTAWRRKDTGSVVKTKGGGHKCSAY